MKKASPKSKTTESSKAKGFSLAFPGTKVSTHAAGLTFESENGLRAGALCHKAKATGQLSPPPLTRPILYPAIGDLVLARVKRVESFGERASVFCDIEFINFVRVAKPFPAQLRLQDLTEYDVDSVNLHDIFQFDQLVKAVVLTIVTSRSAYLISTKIAPDLGVVLE